MPPFAQLTVADRENRREFEKAVHVDKKDFSAIEYCLRKGQRQLETYSQPGIRDIMR